VIRQPLFLLCLALTLAGPGVDSRAATAARRPNVLFLVSDDLNCDLGCYGAPVRTPNLDRLAARGLRFQRAYCQFPLCSPSRASFLSGRRPETTQVRSNPRLGDRGYAPHLRDALPDTVTLPQLFKNAGIPSVRIGKLFHAGVPLSIGTGSADDFISWDYTFNPRGCDRDDLAQVFSLQPGQFGGTVSWLAHPAGDEQHTDGLSAELAVQQLQRFKRADKPFFLAVGFFRPHTPYVAPRKYFDLYPAHRLELPALTEQDRRRAPAPAYASAKREQDTMTDDQRRQAIQAYRACVTFMDAQAGKVLDALDRLGLARHTIVVFASDHGYHLADHGLWQKRSLFERSTRVPLIIAAPGAKAHGGVAPGVVELLDLYPTLAELCGLPAPAYLEGVSLRPVLDDPQARVREAAFTQVDRQGFQGWSIRTERWRYTEWNDGRAGAELYDYETDPAESRNLVNDPAHTQTVTLLQEKLRAHRTSVARKPASPP
jgi:arylsulfatase A-like enzyme